MSSIFYKNKETLIFLCLLAVFAVLLSGCSDQAVSPVSVQQSAEPQVLEMPPESRPEDTQKSLIQILPDSGSFPDEIRSVTVHVPAGCTIAYTLDGANPSTDNDTGLSELTIDLADAPTDNLYRHKDLMLFPYNFRSMLYNDKSLPHGYILRAAAIGEDGSIREEITRSWFPGVSFSERFPGCLVISAVVDPADLLDYDTGILATGKVFDTWKNTDEAKEIMNARRWWEYESNSTQKGKEWERPCILQIYDGGQNPAAEMRAGMRITGGTSRRISQKSFNFYFRKDYGEKRLQYELFDGTEEYKSFRMRAGGNNAELLKFKDMMLQELCADRAVTEARSRPAVLFLNGEYWGPYLLSEKISDQMLQSHYGVDPDQVVVIKEGEVDEGTEDDLASYKELMSFADRDLSDPEVWAEFCDIMDVESFADYCAIRIYIGDLDWSENKNDVLWRTRDSSYNDGRWQYIIYDIENSSGIYDDYNTAAYMNHFEEARRNYPLFASAIRNDDFFRLFLNSIREIGSSCYDPERVEKALLYYDEVWKPLLPDYYKRYGSFKEQWAVNLAYTRRFFQERYDFIIPIVEHYS